MKYLLAVLFAMYFHVLFGQEITLRSSEDSTLVIDARYQLLTETGILISRGYVSENGTLTVPQRQDSITLTVEAPLFQKRSITFKAPYPETIYLEPRARAFDEVVVTGQYEKRDQSEAVQVVRVIDKKKIEAMGAQNLRDVLTNELNIRLTQDNILGAGMSLQGIGGENVKILVDGSPLIGRQNGNIDLSQINLNNIERIEIIEGPMSVNYGTDALAGTINLITKKQFEKGVNAGVTSYYESIGNYNAGLTFGVQGKRTTFSAEAARYYFDGWRDDERNFHIERKRLADTLRTKQYKPKEQLFGSVMISHRLRSTPGKENLMLQVRSGIFTEEIMNRGLPLKPYYTFAFDDYYKTLRFDNSVNLNGNFSKNWSLNSVNAYNYYKRQKNTYYNDLTTLDQQLTTAENDQDTSTFDLLLSRTSFLYDTPKGGFSLETGYEFSLESTRGRRIVDQTRQIGDYALFATAEIKAGKRTTFRPGVRYAYNTAFKAPLLPSLFVRQELGKNTILRFSYSRGFRAPSLKELYFFFVDINHNIQGNPDLDAENSNNFQLNLVTSLKPGKKTAWQLENRFYYNDLNNLITLAQVSGTLYSYVNLLKSRSFGYQLNNKFRVGKLTLEAGANIAGRASQVSEENPALYRSVYPEYRANGSYRFVKWHSTVSVFYKFTGKTPQFVSGTDGSVAQSTISDYQIMDISLSTDFLKRSLLVTIGAKNLFDVTTVFGQQSGEAHSAGSSSLQIGTGRSYFVSLKYHLNIRKHAR